METTRKGPQDTSQATSQVTSQENKMPDQVSHNEQSSDPTHIKLPALDSVVLRQDELNRQQLSQAERDQFQR